MMRRDRKLLSMKRNMNRQNSEQLQSVAFAIGQCRNGHNLRCLIQPSDISLYHQQKVLKNDKDSRVFFVVVPNGVNGGKDFVFFIENEVAVLVTAPLASISGDVLCVRLPWEIDMNIDFNTLDSNNDGLNAVSVFDIEVPSGLSRGQSFAIMVEGRLFFLNDFSQINNLERFKLYLPKRIFSTPNNSENSKLYHTSNGWTRATMIPQLSSKWVRTNRTGTMDESRLDVSSYAFLRNLQIKDWESPYMLEGAISLLCASRKWKNRASQSRGGKFLIHNIDITTARNLNYSQKSKWFRAQCNELCDINSSSQYLWISIDRDKLIPDTLNTIMSLSRADMLNSWKVTFGGDTSTNSIDATRDWFDSITEKMLHPEFGLFQYASSNSMRIQINPYSEIADAESHLIQFRILGRILGKSLLIGHHIANKMSPHIIKMIVGWPIICDDLKFIDQACYDFFLGVQRASAQQLNQMKITFTATMDVSGHTEEIELCPQGKNRVVDMNNKEEFLELGLQYYLFGEVKNQMTEFLLGFYEVIPEPLVTVFSAEEMEFLMCGKQSIDVQDWKQNTIYIGEFKDLGEYHPVCCWFWDLVENFFDLKTQLQLLQFATGMQTVPFGGFSELQGENGQKQLFTLYGSPYEDCPFPRANTMLNRIDLPLYESSNIMYETLLPSIQVGD